MNMETVREALLAYAGTAPAAYGIDFGVLWSGQTALVEVNDGYALGAYQIDSAVYSNLLYTRWSQLLENAMPACPKNSGTGVFKSCVNPLAG